jgi:hypothetical protein
MENFIFTETETVDISSTKVREFIDRMGGAETNESIVSELVANGMLESEVAVYLTLYLRELFLENLPKKSKGKNKTQ